MVMIIPSAEVYNHMPRARARRVSKEQLHEPITLDTLLFDCDEMLWPCEISYYVTSKPVSLVTEHVVTNIIVKCDDHAFMDFEGQVFDHIRAQYLHVEIESTIERKLLNETKI